jgi:hypothetical protein
MRVMAYLNMVAEGTLINSLTSSTLKVLHLPLASELIVLQA